MDNNILNIEQATEFLGVSEKILSLKASNNLAQLLKLDKNITIPENSSLRINYKQQRDVEKLEIKIYWPQRDEFKIL